MGIRGRISGRRRRGTSPHEGILDHYRTFFGAERVEEVHWTPDHMANRLPDFHIARIRPEGPGGMWVFASVGAWRATEDEPHGIEFILVSRTDSVAAMQRLGMVAYYHAGPAANRLGAGHTLPIGEGWVDGSALESILVTLPYLWGPKLEHCQLPDRHIRVLWLMPITTAEHQYARDRGVDALETRFEDAEVNYLDPFRASVV